MSLSYFVPDSKVLSVLPARGFLRDYVTWGMATTDAPAVYHVAIGLTLLSSVCPAMTYILSFGGRTYGHLFVMLVGDSGSRKSTALEYGVSMLRRDHPNTIGMQLGSYEGLVAQCADSPKTYVPESEMSRFLKQAKGDGFLASLKYGYMEAYDAVGLSRKTAKVSVKGREDIRVTLAGAVATHLLEDLVDPTDLTGGFLSRFIIALGERDRTSVDLVDTSVTKEQLTDRLKHIEDVSFVCPIEMTDQAKAIHADWIRRTDPVLQRQQGKRTTSFMERAGAMSRKIGMLLALDEHAQRYQIGTSWGLHGSMFPKSIELSGETFLHAAQIAEMFLMSQAAFAEDLAVTSPGKARKRVLAAIPWPADDPMGVPLGTITYQTEMDNATAQRWLLTLEDQGFIEKVAYAGGSGSGMRVTYHRRTLIPGRDPAKDIMFPEGIPASAPAKVTVGPRPELAMAAQGPQGPQQNYAANNGPVMINIPPPPPLPQWPEDYDR